MSAPYELADFDPEDGHLHGCPWRSTAFAHAPNRANCDCAAHLYAIAQDEVLAHEHVGWIDEYGQLWSLNLRNGAVPTDRMVFAVVQPSAASQPADSDSTEGDES